MKSAARVLPLVIAVLLIAGVSGLAFHDDTTSVDSSKTPTTLAVSPSSTVPGETTTTAKANEPLVSPELAGLVAKLEAFVEKTRGLKFLKPVKVTLLGDKDFRKKVTASSGDDAAAIDRITRELRALDLIPAGADIGKIQKELLGGLVLGFYDDKEKALFVRGGKPTPAVRETLVHELTHALQDQHFNIDRPDVDKAKDESGQSFSGLLEGDAVRVEEVYKRTLSAKEQRDAEEEQSKGVGDLDDVPPVLLETLLFPYRVGPPFVATILSAAGQARLDEAFRHPPTTSEQLIHPERFLAGEGALPVAEPPTNAGAKPIDQGVFGELGFLQQLENVITDPDQLRRAAAGWGGDRYVAWDEGAKTCVRVDVVMDTPQDADELRSALNRWVNAHKGATLEGTSPIRFTSCG